MQISSIQSNPYVTANSNKLISSNTVSNTDYSTLSLDKLKKLSYDETKNHIAEIKSNIENKFDKKNLSDQESIELGDYQFSLSIIDYTKSEQFNKSFFDTFNSIDGHFNKMVFQSELQTNINDYYSGKKVEASFMVGDSIHSSESLTKQQMNSINFDDFLSQMLLNFGKDVSSSKGSVQQQYQGIVDGYSLLKQNYDKQKSEPIYA